MIVKLGMAVFVFVLLPLVFGACLRIVRGRAWALSAEVWADGVILLMGLFLPLSLPPILLGWRLSSLVLLVRITVLVLAALILLLAWRKGAAPRLPDLTLRGGKRAAEGLGPVHYLALLGLLVLVGLQIFIKLRYSVVNNDDSNFVGLAAGMIETDSLYRFNAEGYATTLGFTSRYCLAPIFAFYAVLAQILHIHVTIVMHSVIPPLALVLANAVYLALGRRLEKEKGEALIFVFLLNMLSLFSFSMKGWNRYLLNFTWMGRALLAGLVIPYLWICLLELYRLTEKKKGEGDQKDRRAAGLSAVKLFFACLAGCLCSEMSIALLPIILACGLAAGGVRSRTAVYWAGILASMLPALVLGCIYIVLKGI